MMQLQTERLIIREAEQSDAEDFLRLKYDSRVLAIIPDLFGNDADIGAIKALIEGLIDRRDSGDFREEIYYVVALAQSGDFMGLISVSYAGYLHETQIGWMMLEAHRGQGYAAEAAAAVSDALLQTFGWPYMIATIDEDNIASCRTAQKSGFGLFEKRVPYNYAFSGCDAENFDEVARYFARSQVRVGAGYYYFRKYHPDIRVERFYGDMEYHGRFA